MTTTELIKLLKKYEFGGATGRPREVMFQIDDEIVGTDNIEVDGTGDGLVTELFLSLPSAERKKGKWIGEPKDGIEAMFFKPKCSVCGFESAEVKNYCPNCGSFNGGVE